MRSFIRIGQVLMGDNYVADTHINKQTRTEGKINIFGFLLNLFICAFTSHEQHTLSRNSVYIRHRDNCFVQLPYSTLIT